MSKTSYIIGIDAGTSMTKAVAFDLNGKELAQSSRRTRTSTPHTSWIEADMDFVWEDVLGCVKNLIAENGEPLSIGITSTGDGTWMMDASGRPVRPGILWCDGRAQAEVNEMHSSGVVKKAYPLSGTSIFTGTQAAQIRWLERHEPDALQRAAVIFHEKDWLLYRFTGEISSDATDECLTNIDLIKREYDDSLLSIQGISAYRGKFPALRPTFRNVAPTTSAVTTELGLSHPVMVAAGPMDVSAHALGVGAIKHGQGSSVLGTAGLHQVAMDKTNIDPENMSGMTLCHCVDKVWLRLVAAMIATPNLDWALKVFNVPREKQSDYEALERELRKIPIGCEGVLFHPYIFPGGERGPFVKTTAKGSFTGINQLQTRYHMIRAVYEGVALSTVDCFRHMPVKPYMVLLSGGGAKSEFWSQMIADGLGLPVMIPTGTEYGAKGAAINSAVAGSVFASYEEATQAMIRHERTYEPDPSRMERYSELYELYKSGYRMQMAYWDQRAKLLDSWEAKRDQDQGEGR